MSWIRVFKRVMVSAIAGSALSLSIIAMPASGSGSSPNPPLVWNSVLSSSPSNIQGIGQVNSTDCVTKDFCVSGGFITNASGQQAMVEVKRGSSKSEFILGASLNTGNSAEINKVSCISAEHCFAVGEYSFSQSWSYRPFISQWNGTTWTTVGMSGSIDFSNGGMVSAVDCVSEGFCALTGEYDTNRGRTTSFGFAATWDGSIWTASPVATDLSGVDSPSWAVLTGLSCSSAAFCVAVGTTKGGVQPLTERWNGANWIGELLGVDLNAGSRGSLMAVSCTSSAFCVAGGYVSDVWNNQYPLRSQWNGTSWTSTEVSTIDGTNPSGAISSVSCAGLSICLAVGGSFTMRFDGTTWTNEFHFPPNYQSVGGTFYFKSATCVSTELCIAAGQSIAANSEYNNSAVLISTWTPNGWVDSTSLLSGAYYDWISSISCPTSTYCLGGGIYGKNYQDQQGKQPLLVEAIPPTVPSAPSAVSVTPGSGSLAVSWTQPPTGGLPIISYGASDGLGDSCTTSGMSCQISGLNAGTSYSITVTATNAVGQSAPSTALSGTPFGIATSPQNLVLSSVMWGHTSAISASWKAPSFDGATPITSYRVTVQPPTSYRSSTCITTTFTCVLLGTTPGVNYTVTVSAQNLAGTSPGLSGSLIAQSAPSVPQNVSVVPSLGGATIAWQPPSINGGSPLLGYTVTVGTATYSTSQTSIVLSHLSTTASTRVSIVANNAIGSSIPLITDEFIAWSGLNATPALRLSPTVMSAGNTANLLINSKVRTSSLKVAWSVQPNGSCSTNNAGQCTFTLTPSAPGTYAIVVTGSGIKPLATTLYVPGLRAPSQIKHGSKAVVAISNCPPSARVILNLSDGRTVTGVANAKGQLTYSITFPKQGAVSMSLSIASYTSVGSWSSVVY